VYFDSRNTNPHVDWKAGIEVDVAPQSMLYATIQTGYTNGSYQYFNNSGLLGPQNEGTAPLIKPTKLLSYTVGSKNRFFNNRLEINDEAYYYDYKDLLIAAFSANPLAFGNTFFNANLVEIYGNQLDVKFHVTANDQLQANLGYLHARAIDFIVGEPAFNYGGFELPESPDVTATLSYAHTFNLPNGDFTVFSGDTHYETGYWNTFQHNPTTHQPAFTQSDMSLTYYSSTGDWNVGAWVKNVENSAVVSIGAYIGAGTAQGIGDLYPPRTFGLRGVWYFGRPR
jgi:iron complex outermembrane receptor protein